MRKAAIVVLTLATAVIHLAYAAPNFDGVMMALSGLGYIALLGLLYLPIPAVRRRHGLFRTVLAGYAAVIFVGYFVYALATGEWSVPLGPVAKVIEAALIGLLWSDRTADRARSDAVPRSVGGRSTRPPSTDSR